MAFHRKTEQTVFIFVCDLESLTFCQESFDGKEAVGDARILRKSIDMFDFTLLSNCNSTIISNDMGVLHALINGGDATVHRPEATADPDYYVPWLISEELANFYAIDWHSSHKFFFVTLPTKYDNIECFEFHRGFDTFKINLSNKCHRQTTMYQQKNKFSSFLYAKAVSFLLRVDIKNPRWTVNWLDKDASHRAETLKVGSNLMNLFDEPPSSLIWSFHLPTWESWDSCRWKKNEKLLNEPSPERENRKQMIYREITSWCIFTWNFSSYTFCSSLFCCLKCALNV